MSAEQLGRRRILDVALALLLALTLVMISNPHRVLAGTTYYVALTGSDANPGTGALPWRTIQKAANTMTPGDSVIVRTGDYGERVRVTRSGSAGQPITFLASGSISMKGFTIRASYITVNGFYITGTPNDPINGYGIRVEGSHNTIENNYMYFNLRGGLILDADVATPALTSHNVVRNNRMERNQGVGIDVRGEDNLVEGNEILATIQYHPQWPGPPPYVDADGIHFHGRGHIFRKNYIHDISYTQPENVDPHIDCFQTWSDASHGVASDTVFEQNFCVVLENQAATKNGQGFMIEGATSNLVIKNNIILAYKGINAQGSTGLQILNNTIGNSLAFTQYWPGGIRLTTSPNATVQNNVFVDVGAPGVPYLDLDAASRQGLRAGYNCVYMSDGRSPSGSPWPNDLWNVDPRFADRANHDYHLRAGSPAIDKGAPQAQVPVDYEGTPRPAGRGWDIGAFEATGDRDGRRYLPLIRRSNY